MHSWPGGLFVKFWSCSTCVLRFRVLRRLVGGSLQRYEWNNQWVTGSTELEPHLWSLQEVWPPGALVISIAQSIQNVKTLQRVQATVITALIAPGLNKWGEAGCCYCRWQAWSFVRLAENPLCWDYTCQKESCSDKLAFGRQHISGYKHL